MMLDYINEAFKSLDLLTEDVFRADSEGIEELSDFVNSSEDEEGKISIIDMDAETEDDLQDSYVGKVIVDCNICHSHVFKDKEDIKIDTEGVVDIEEECPYCGENNGFVIIGEIHEFKPETDEGEIETPEEEVEETNDQIDESLQESLSIDEIIEELGGVDYLKDRISEIEAAYPGIDIDEIAEMLCDDMSFEDCASAIEYVKETLPESLTEESNMRKLRARYPELDRNFDGDLLEEAFKPTAGETIVKDDGREILVNTNTKWQGKNLYQVYTDHNVHVGAISADDDQEAEQKWQKKQFEESLDTSKLNELFGFNKTKKPDSYVAVVSNNAGRSSSEMDGAWVVTGNLAKEVKNILETYGENVVARSNNGSTRYVFDATPKQLRSIKNEIADISGSRFVKNEKGSFNQYQDSSWKDEIVQSLISINPTVRQYDESFKNVALETDDQKMTMVSGDDGKVVVTTEPTESDVAEGEIVSAVTPETEEEILDANSDVVEEEPAEETEAPAEEATEEQPAEEGTEETTDVEIDEVDEESMSGLGESYLKRVYENVDSFKLTSCSTTPTQLVLEGLITFKSGAKKNTGFIFEAKDATKDGKVRFIGENAHLARGRKAFTLVGCMSDKKLMCESFTYNYRAKNAEGKSTRVYGKVNRNK